jgi:hypothetical protein
MTNLLGTGGDNKANLTSFKPGERRVGRAKGTPNRLSKYLAEFHAELFEAAEEMGYMRHALVVDKDGNPEVGLDGVPTGRMAWTPTGEGGFRGWLMWLCINNSTAYVALMKSGIPQRIEAKIQNTFEDNPYRTAEEVEAEMKLVGLSDRVIDLVLEDLRT